MGMSAPSIDEERETRVMGTPPTVKVEISNIYYHLNIYCSRGSRGSYLRNVCDTHDIMDFVFIKRYTIPVIHNE